MSNDLERELQEARARIQRQNEEMRMVLESKDRDLQRQEKTTKWLTIKPIVERVDNLSLWLESLESGKVTVKDVKEAFEEFRTFVLDLSK